MQAGGINIGDMGAGLGLAVAGMIRINGFTDLIVNLIPGGVVKFDNDTSVKHNRVPVDNDDLANKQYVDNTNIGKAVARAGIGIGDFLYHDPSNPVFGVTNNPTTIQHSFVGIAITDALTGQMVTYKTAGI